LKERGNHGDNRYLRWLHFQGRDVLQFDGAQLAYQDHEAGERSSRRGHHHQDARGERWLYLREDAGRIPQASGEA